MSVIKPVGLICLSTIMKKGQEFPPALSFRQRRLGDAHHLSGCIRVVANQSELAQDFPARCIARLRALFELDRAQECDRPIFHVQCQNGIGRHETVQNDLVFAKRLR